MLKMIEGMKVAAFIIDQAEMVRNWVSASETVAPMGYPVSWGQYPPKLVQAEQTPRIMGTHGSLLCSDWEGWTLGLGDMAKRSNL